MKKFTTLKAIVKLTSVLALVSVTQYVHAETTTELSNNQEVTSEIKNKVAEDDYQIDIIDSKNLGNGLVNIYLKKGIDLNKYEKLPICYGSQKNEKILGEPIVENNYIIGFSINFSDLINVEKEEFKDFHYSYVTHDYHLEKFQSIDSTLLTDIVNKKAYVNPDNLKYNSISKNFTLETSDTLIKANRLAQLTPVPDDNWQTFASQSSDASGITNFPIPNYLNLDRLIQFTVSGNTYGETFTFEPYSMPYSPVGENILYNPNFSKGLAGWDSATLNRFDTLQTNTITGNILNMKMTPQNAQSLGNRMTLLQFVNTLPFSNYKFSIDVKANKIIPGSYESRIQFKQIFTIRGQNGLGEGGSVEIKSDDLGKWIHLEGTANGVIPYQLYTPGLDVIGIEDVDVKNPEIVRLD